VWTTFGIGVLVAGAFCLAGSEAATGFYALSAPTGLAWGAYSAWVFLTRAGVEPRAGSAPRTGICRETPRSRVQQVETDAVQRPGGSGRGAQPPAGPARGDGNRVGRTRSSAAQEDSPRESPTVHDSGRRVHRREEGRYQLEPISHGPDPVITARIEPPGVGRAVPREDYREVST
jgi:hypothetical protein